MSRANGCAAHVHRGILLAPEMPANAVPIFPVELVLLRARENAQLYPVKRREWSKSRMVSNYVRHCLTCYDATLTRCDRLQCMKVKRRILAEIGQVYPVAGKACRRGVRLIDRRIAREEQRQAQSAHRLILSA